mmetsp:Transcript_9913/g.28775  ORF Transcript_9913/g.28775 Transcript_9913/m.28775 type:complete len:238 (+) Transcript_9913:2087-2800(+)
MTAPTGIEDWNRERSALSRLGRRPRCSKIALAAEAMSPSLAPSLLFTELTTDSLQLAVSSAPPLPTSTPAEKSAECLRCRAIGEAGPPTTGPDCGTNWLALLALRDRTPGVILALVSLSPDSIMPSSAALLGRRFIWLNNDTGASSSNIGSCESVRDIGEAVPELRWSMTSCSAGRPIFGAIGAVVVALDARLAVLLPAATPPMEDLWMLSNLASTAKTFCDNMESSLESRSSMSCK